MKTVMNTAMEYAKTKNVIAVNCAEGLCSLKSQEKGLSYIKNRCTKDIDSPTDGTVDRGKQRNTDLYANFICGVNGIKTW